ncbi:muropeptide transporter [Enhygromyxa salina]|uniref:Muropeptide transporter n=1 Tax=Enhygromyxa salina TaxID=215803 RepID=A0A2S9XKG3_9BACT|nr:MFS transporter [Enhygromyxa salina]PRP93220.1 muropeptide transporter [Enhygromyxa salina]
MATGGPKPPAQKPLAARLGILSVFYLVQGLPFGFQAKALPVYLATHGLSLTHIGFAGAVSAPWLLKPLWAPLVDRFGSARFGRRRSWIVPLQAALASTCLGLAFVPAEALLLFLAMIALTNLFAATMDIAVDGLAIDMLAPEELGWGNIAQVVAYKVGMQIGGGILLWASQWIGWRGLFEAMSALIFVALIVTLIWRERGTAPSPSESPPAARASVRAMLSTLYKALASPGGLALLAVVATYKIGESVSDAMFEPFLVRYASWGEARIGLILGVYCMFFSLAGSFLGGWLATRVGIYRALVGFAIARTLSIGAIVWLASLAPGAIGDTEVVLAKGLEELAGGGLTTAMFAFMMSRVDRRIGATHYTLLAGVEVLGKAPGGLLSGVLADALGFVGTFATGLGISLVCLPLLALVRQRPSARPDSASA